MTAPTKRPAVLLIGNYPPPYGGVPRHIEDLVPALVNDGLDVHVLSGGDSGLERRGAVVIHKYGRWTRRQALLTQATSNAWRWRRYFRSFGLGEARELYGFLSLISVGHRIVREHGISVIKAYNLRSYGPVGAVLSAEHGVPLLLASFGEYFKFPEFFHAHSELVRFMFRQASRRLSMTEHCAAAYRALPEGRPYEIVPYGVDLDVFDPRKPGAQPPTAGSPHGDPVILYLARLTQEMGLAVFDQAARIILTRTADVKIVIAGKPEELAGAALQLGREFPARVRVELDVPFEKLPDLYREATVVAVPTLNDRACGSLSAAEASAMGKPVVASQVGGVPEFLRDGETGTLVPPGDAAALADALLALCRNPERASSMGRAGRLFAGTHLDKRTTNHRISQLLFDLHRASQNGSTGSTGSA